VIDFSGRTPLALAGADGYETIVRVLLGHGADFNVRDADDKTVLDMAINGGHQGTVQLLLKHGATGTRKWTESVEKDQVVSSVSDGEVAVNGVDAGK